MGNTPSYSKRAQLKWYSDGKDHFTQSGFEKAAAKFDPDDVSPGCFGGRTVLVLGGNKGFGFECAVIAAELGAAHVHIVSRTAAKNEEALGVLRSRLPATVDVDAVFRFHAVEFTLIAEVRRFGEAVARGEVAGLERGADVVFNNCAYMPQKRTTTAEGHEVIAAMIYASTLLFPALVLPVLPPGARFINISTSAACLVECNASDIDLEKQEKYDGGLVYAIARKGQVYVTQYLHHHAQRMTVSNNDDATKKNSEHDAAAQPLRPPAFFSMHPGWADVQALRNGQPGFYDEHQKSMRTVAQGVDTAIWLAVASAAKLETHANAGGFWFDRWPYPMDYTLAGTSVPVKQRTKLWAAVVEYVGGAMPALGITGAVDADVEDELRAEGNSSSCSSVKGNSSSSS